MNQNIEKHEDSTWQGNNGELILLKERKHREPEDFDHKYDGGYYVRSKFSRPDDWIYVDGKGW